jgi:radical SAM superfamily enzyme YgiQ (UPF0313 family)
MRVLMILPALTEAKGPFFRPIKYSLFPPLGLATLAAFLHPDDEARIIDEHVEREIDLDATPEPAPDLVVIQAYITSARRAYALADHFRAHGSVVVLGGLHVTSLPDEAAPHADAIFLGPGEQTFPEFLRDFRAGGRAGIRRVYDSRAFPRTLAQVPPIRRDLIRRGRYLVPNSIVVSRGCPHHCSFCYKDAFFAGGKSFYTQRVDDALAEIDRLPGRHLYFLDDHMLGDVRFSRALFDGLRGCGRVFQGAATVDSLLNGDLVERAVDAGLRSIFIGFETLSESNLRDTNKRQNLQRAGKRRDYEAVCRRMDSLGVSINGSFVFGLDGDDPGVFERTVDWACRNGVTTATFHVATPYPGTEFYRQIARQGRLLHSDWDLYDTRHAVFRPAGMSIELLEEGYWSAYRTFYSLGRIAQASRFHARPSARIKHLGYAWAWKHLEHVWNAMIRSGGLALARPVIETGLDLTRPRRSARSPIVEQAEAAASTTPLTLEGAEVPEDTPSPQGRAA